MARARRGTRLTRALAQQLGAEMTQPASPVGTTFTLLVPPEAGKAG